MRTVLVELKCTYTCMSSAAHIPTEFREIDFREVEKVEEFCRGGCGCSTNCASAFTKKHYLATRANAQQLERKELDMVVMGQVMAFTFCSQVPQNISKHRYQVKQRERNASAFYHNGLRVCKRTFLFLHDIGDFLSALTQILKPLRTGLRGTYCFSEDRPLNGTMASSMAFSM